MPHRLEYVRKVGGVEFYKRLEGHERARRFARLDAFEENVILIMAAKRRI